MSGVQKSVLLAAAAVLVLQAFAPDISAATLDVQARISFERVIDVGKQSDVVFGEMAVRPNDRVTLDTAGNMRLNGKGEVLAPYGRASVVTIGDSRGQIMNFLPANYTLAPGIESLQVHCAFQTVGNGDCDKGPVFGKQENTLFIGMDMTVSVGITSVDNKIIPSFDMSIVYQ